MSNLPEPPTWPRTTVAIDDDVAEALSSIRTTAFFDNRGDAVEEAQERFTIVGQGTGRIVVAGGGLLEDTVAKVSVNQRGYQANTAEKYGREDYPNVAPYLPPVLATDSSSHWAVYERCETPGDRDVREAMERVLDDAGVSYRGAELAGPNIGRYGGRPCIIDWAELLR